MAVLPAARDEPAVHVDSNPAPAAHAPDAMPTAAANAPAIPSPFRHRHVLGVDEAGGDEVGRMDPRVGDRNAASGADRILGANRPAMLDKRDRGGEVIRDGLVERPRLLLG